MMDESAFDDANWIPTDWEDIGAKKALMLHFQKMVARVSDRRERSESNRPFARPYRCGRIQSIADSIPCLGLERVSFMC